MSLKRFSNSKWNTVIDCRNHLTSSLRADFKEKAQMTSSGEILDCTDSELVERFELLGGRIRQLLKKWPRLVNEVRVFETLAILVAHCFRFMKLSSRGKKGGKKRPVSQLLLTLLEEYETVSGTRDLTFLPSDSGATNVARNTLPRPSLVKGGPVIFPTQEKILCAFGVKGTQLTELAKGGSNREKVGNLDQEHGQVRLLIDMAVQEEVEIALDELVDKVECNVLGLPQPPVPLEVRSMRSPAKRTFSFCLRL